MSEFTLFLLTIISSGAIGSAITYVLTLKSKTKIAKSEAEIAETKAQHDKLDLSLDKYDYLQETCDKYIKDYHELELHFRNRTRELSEEIATLLKDNSEAISNKCNEIASLKAQITYLKGIRCYDVLCPKRIKQNPEKINKEQ